MVVSGAQETASSAWFGTAFAQLHPRLQQLHRQGGRLRGSVEMAFGHGLAGVIGRRMARRLGLPAAAGSHQLEVHISHRDGVLHWDRRFDDGRQFLSTFAPHGGWPDGWWIEQTALVALRLQVDIVDGGWHWRCIGAQWQRWNLPRWLLPRSTACKCIEQDRYRFSVSFSLPLLGELLRYGGLLDQVSDG